MRKYKCDICKNMVDKIIFVCYNGQKAKICGSKCLKKWSMKNKIKIDKIQFSKIVGGTD